MFVAKIHNNQLGRCVEVQSSGKGIALIEEMFREQFNRDLTPEEAETLENDFSLVIDNDPDNVFSFCIGMMEGE